MKRKLSPRFLAALTLFSLVGQIAWVVENMYLNVFLYKMFAASAADISAMVAASAIAATLTTVLIGALSDKIGKRKLFMCGGYILWGVSILAFALIRTDVIEATFPALLAASGASAASLAIGAVIALDCLMTFFGSSANDAAFNAWLTDSTDPSNRGAAEGINAMMPLVAILAVFGGFMAFDLNKGESWLWIFLIIGIAVTLIGVAGIFLIQEPDTKRAEGSYLRTVLHGFSPKTVRENASLYLSLSVFVLFNIAIQIFMPYLILYYEVSLGMSDYVLVMAPAIILASIATALWGRVYDKKGLAFSGWIALASLVTGFIVLLIARAKAPVFVGSLFMMCGYLCGMAVFGARIRDLTPENEAGRFQGVRIFSQVLVPGIIGPFIGKTVLQNAEKIQNSDGTESFIPHAGIFAAALVVALLTALCFYLILKKEKPRTRRDLTTPYEGDPAAYDKEYPRPQLRRDSYLPLNGTWHLSVKKGKKETDLGEILVPFPPESRLSRIERQLKRAERYVYERTFTLPDDFMKDRVLIHFGAVDQIATLRVNDFEVGTHVGGYLPFSFDITDALVKGENRIHLTVTDNLDTALPYGKQTKKRGGMWYTPVSGIWQSVWMESVPRNHFRSLNVTTTLDAIELLVEGGNDQKTLTIHTENGDITHRFKGNFTKVTIDDPILWTPDTPHLYEFTLTDGKDVVHSYFGLRSVGITRTKDNAYITLNGKPILCHGLLDQGYFSDGIYLPAAPKGFLDDILRAKALGFNMLRKHIKIEPDLFYYYCDKYGMLVFQDMVNSGRYSFLIDTALPTVGLRRGITHPASERRRAQFERDAKETILHLYNHPSVIYYTIFNEGWGQHDADRLYEKLRAFDPTRIYDTTSGWFTTKKSDVQSEHIYFKKLRLKHRADRPLVLSEFGGYSAKIENHSFNLDKTYGYRFFDKAENFREALLTLYTSEVIPAIEHEGLCATVLTQLTDVEDETNGLITYDRQVIKVDESEMRALSEELHARFEAQQNRK